jgi:hypothetical protein
MKKPTVLRLWPVLCTLLILSACQKETSTQQQQETPPNEQTNIRATGALPDDPAKVAKVPLIVSSDFLKNKEGYLSSALLLNAKGKPVKPGTDATPPSVSITSPSNGAIVSGTVNVAVSASDNVGVSSVNLSVDGVTISTLNSAPYNFSWTADGNSHTITATAKDAAGNSASNTITVSKNTVTADITPPSVSITSPANGASVSGTVTVSVSASDNIGVSAVSLSVDGVLISTVSSSPYSFSWNTANVADGNHSLSAAAKDAAGNTKTVTIAVAKNTTITTLPPSTTVPSSYSLLMPPVQNQGTEFSCVAFAVGYAARSAEQFYKTKATSYSYATNIFSPEFLYNQTKISADCGSGTSIMQALDFMKSIGICTWQSMPYSSTNGCSLLPNGSQSSEAANYKISSYSAVYKSDITAIKTSLINHHPVVFAAAIDNSFINAQPGFIWKAYSGSASISHAMAICGYDDTKHAWKVMSSWGTSWGDNGYSWIDYDFLSQTGSVWAFVMAP